MSLYRPREQSLGQKFSQWFDFTFVNYSPEVRQKAIKAGWEATCGTLFKMPAQCGRLPGPVPGQQLADLVYSPETQDIRYRKEWGSGEPATIGQTLSQQEELDYLQPGRDALWQWRSRRVRSTTRCSPTADAPEPRSRSHRRYSLWRSRSMTRSPP